MQVPQSFIPIQAQVLKQSEQIAGWLDALRSANEKDVVILKLQQWGVDHCKWISPGSLTASTAPADASRDDAAQTAKE
jgi:hypothetical protein